MKAEAIKDYLLVNGEVEKVLESKVFEKIDTPPIYEVIRVMDSIPLFLDDHIERMRDSARLVELTIERQDEDIRQDIFRLIEKNEIVDLNVKLLVAEVEGEQVFLVYFIESFYPPQEYYEEGIHTILYNHERPNPNAKVLLTDFKEDVARKLEEEKAFEALLVNREKSISEGSRSNIFFVRSGRIHTAPAGNVLMGITRKYILKACEDEKIDVIEENFPVDQLTDLEAAFMSGTSVDLLPISSIGNLKLDSMNNEIFRKLYDGYSKYVKKDIEKNRR